MSADLALAAHLGYAQMKDSTKERDMTNTREVRIGDHKLKFIGDQVPVIVTAGTDEKPIRLTLEDVAAIAEFAADAWIALADEEYRPVIITEKGYVADEGVVSAGERVVPKA